MEILIKAIITHRKVRKSSAVFKDDGRHFGHKDINKHVWKYEINKVQWFNNMTTDYKVSRTINVTFEIEHSTVNS